MTKIESRIDDIIGSISSLKIFDKSYPLLWESKFLGIEHGLLQSFIIRDIINKDNMEIGIILHNKSLQYIDIPTIFRIISSVDSNTKSYQFLFIIPLYILINLVQLVQVGMFSVVEVMVVGEVWDLFVLNSLEEIVLGEVAVWEGLVFVLFTAHEAAPFLLVVVDVYVVILGQG